MKDEKIFLASDNCAPTHPLVIEAILAANEGYAPSYGGDLWTAQAGTLLQEAVGRKGRVFIVPSGTGSNVLALKLASARHESVICTDIAHIASQESGAAESVVGCKFLTVPHKEGKLTPGEVVKRVKKERASGKHGTVPRVLSITQSTEVGTVYTLSELEALKRVCHEENLLMHMDGSRLYNAAVYLKASLEEMVRFVDILSLGGTKNGLMCTEALLIFNRDLEKGCDHLHKQTLQLVSKMRYLSAQYIPFLKNQLWKTLALEANQRAKEIAAIIESVPQLRITAPVETNQIFFTLPKEWIPQIQEHIACYVWDEEISEIRFVTSWNTSEKDVKGVAHVFSKLQKKIGSR